MQAEGQTTRLLESSQGQFDEQRALKEEKSKYVSSIIAPDIQELDLVPLTHVPTSSLTRPPQVDSFFTNKSASEEGERLRPV